MKHEMDPFRIPASWCDYSFFVACARLRKATTVMERRSHFLHFLLCGVASQPASQTDRLLIIDPDDPSDESMNGWLAGWLARWWW